MGLKPLVAAFAVEIGKAMVNEMNECVVTHHCHYRPYTVSMVNCDYNLSLVS